MNKIIQIAWDAYKRIPEDERNYRKLSDCLDYARTNWETSVIPKCKRIAGLLKEIIKKEIETGEKCYLINTDPIDLDETTGWHTYEYQEISLSYAMANPDTVWPNLVCSESEIEEQNQKAHEDALICAARNGYRLDEYYDYFSDEKNA